MPDTPENITPSPRIDLLAEARHTVKKLLDKVSLVALTLGAVSSAASIFRITREGLHPNVIADMIFFPIIVLIILLRNRFRETTALGLLVGITTVNAFFNFATLGLASVSFVILATCNIITLVLAGTRKGFIYLGISVGVVALTGAALQFGLLPPVRLSAGYINAPNVWVMQVATYLVFTIIMLVTVGNIQDRLGEVLNRMVGQSRELEDREESYRLLTENMRDVVFVQDMNMNITYSSPSVEQVLGYTPEEVKAIKMNELMTPESVERAMTLFGDAVRRAMSGEEVKVPEMEFDYVRKDGSTFPGAIRPTFIRDKAGKLAGSQGILLDISDRKTAEAGLKTALDEKDLLLRELYHRTKNNMQVVHSMLSLQSGHTDDPAALSLFKDIQGRIQAMSLVHQKLYTSQTLSSINLAEYVQELYDLLGRGYHDEAVRTTLCLDIGTLPVSIDFAIPCGLILNELITNSFKYAFPDGRDGQISVKVRRDGDGEMTMEYSDNGVGVPEDFDFRDTGTLGMQVVFGIVEHQLQGAITCTGSEGVSCVITFKDTLYRERV